MISHEVHSLGALRAWLNAGADLSGLVVQNVDLRTVTQALLTRGPAGLILLGCRLELSGATRLIEAGAVIFPAITGKPYAPFRSTLYTAAELFDGFEISTPESYARTPDAKIYAHAKARGIIQPKDIVEALAQRLHDFSVTDAIGDFLADAAPERCLAIMGGHNMLRGAKDYIAIARLARALTRDGYLLLSGGGPGAMEATHLGASFANRDSAELSRAVNVLTKAPHYKDALWLSQAFRVITDFDLRRAQPDSLAIPTWLYGHEPPTPFAPHIAKYFSNSVREEGLITLATGGIIFAPGNAGTIQEIFQDFAQNHYATTGTRSPMVFLNSAYWTEQRAIYPVIADYARGQSYADIITIVDDWRSAAAFIKATPPRKT